VSHACSERRRRQNPNQSPSTSSHDGIGAVSSQDIRLSFRLTCVRLLR
jgi:hypothetical protein